MNVEDVVQVWERRPFKVSAARLTLENISAVAEWCEGEIHLDVDGRTYLQVAKIDKPKNDYQRRAYIGSYLVKAGIWFKIYSKTSFVKSFHQP